MDEAKMDVQREKEMRRSAKPALTAEDELARLNTRLTEMQKELEFTLYRLKKVGPRCFGGPVTLCPREESTVLGLV